MNVIIFFCSRCSAAFCFSVFCCWCWMLKLHSPDDFRLFFFLLRNEHFFPVPLYSLTWLFSRFVLCIIFFAEQKLVLLRALRLRSPSWQREKFLLSITMSRSSARVPFIPYVLHCFFFLSLSVVSHVYLCIEINGSVFDVVQFCLIYALRCLSKTYAQSKDCSITKATTTATNGRAKKNMKCKRIICLSWKKWKLMGKRKAINRQDLETMNWWALEKGQTENWREKRGRARAREKKRRLMNMD